MQSLGLAPSAIPNYLALGLGFYPDYIGSDDYVLGVAPVGRLSWGEQRYVSLEVNYVSVNLIEDRNWRFGPAGMWRFGRKDTEDKVVDRLPEIDGSLDLGAFGAYEYVGTDPRDRWWAGAHVLHGVTGDNDGYTVSGSIRRWMPVGRFGAFGASLGATYGSSDYMDTYFSVSQHGAVDSGLPIFDAGSGTRDVRLTAVFLQPISKEWILGAGVLYGRLFGDAADSPIVSDRGDRNQFVVGFGVGHAF